MEKEEVALYQVLDYGFTRCTTAKQAFYIVEIAVFLVSNEDGIWRCKGGLANASLPTCTTFPILLDTSSHITHLIVMACHEHIEDVKDTLTELRSMYWVVKEEVL